MADCCSYHCGIGGNREKAVRFVFGGSLAVTTEDLKNGIIACSPAIIFIVVVLIAALIVVVAAGKLKQPKRALVRAQAPIAILLAITLSVNWVILGVEYSVVNSVFAEDVKVSDETMASGRAIADQIASEGIVLLKNDDKALPLSAVQSSTCLAGRAFARCMAAPAPVTVIQAMRFL